MTANPKKKKRKENEPEPTRFIAAVTPTIPASMNVYDSISFVFDEPLDHYIGGAIHLKQKVDSLWKEAPLPLRPIPLNCVVIIYSVIGSPERNMNWRLIQWLLSVYTDCIPIK